MISQNFMHMATQNSTQTALKGDGGLQKFKNFFFPFYSIFFSQEKIKPYNAHDRKPKHKNMLSATKDYKPGKIPKASLLQYGLLPIWVFSWGPQHVFQYLYSQNTSIMLKKKEYIIFVLCVCVIFLYRYWFKSCDFHYTTAPPIHIKP